MMRDGTGVSCSPDSFLLGRFVNMKFASVMKKRYFCGAEKKKTIRISKFA